MAHPGRIVYAHAPKTDGFKFFYITYSRRRGLCEVKACPLGGEPFTIDIHPLDLLDSLRQGQVNGIDCNAEIVRRAAKALTALAERRGLM